MELQKKLAALKLFLQEQIWLQSNEGQRWFEQLGYRTVRVTILSARAYVDDQLPVRASALTFFTLLSVVPVLALGFGIAKGFGLDKVLEEVVIQNLSGQKEVADYILSFTHSMVNSAKGGLVAGIGLGVLLWSVFKLLMNIEDAFNVIWDVKTPRTYLRKFTDYFSLMLFAPFLLIVSSSATVFVTTQLSSFESDSAMMTLASPAFFVLVRAIPYFIMSGLFTLLFMVMPNTRVNPSAAIVAGVVTGVVFQIFQGAYILLQTYMTSYNAVYGSFAALPLFLIWLQFSWLIVVLGGEVSYAIQHEHVKGTASKDEGTSMLMRKKYALRVMHLIISRFKAGKHPLSARVLADRTSAPLPEVLRILDILLHSNLIMQVLPLRGPTALCYAPARSIAEIQIAQVIEAVETYGANQSGEIKEGELREKFKVLDEIVETEVKKVSADLLRDV